MNLKNKKILITGACGFIGSHLIEYLLDECKKVRAFVFYNSFNSLGWLDTLPKNKLKNIDVFTGDIRDYSYVRNAVKNSDIIFHLAALVGIPFSYHSPDSYVDTNIKGTLNILQSAREFEVDKVIITSTSEVYGTADYVPIDEKHPLKGQSPYSATKIGADKIAESFYRSFKMPVVIARPFNTYGPRQSARAIIPTIISQILSDAKEIKLGNLFPTRDLNYVEDICRGFIEIAKSDRTLGRVINICSQKEISVRNLCRLILKLMNSDKRIREDKKRIRPKDSEVKRLLGDNSLICSITNWKPHYSLTEGLQRTIEWFSKKENLSGYKPTHYNI